MGRVGHQGFANKNKNKQKTRRALCLATATCGTVVVAVVVCVCRFDAFSVHWASFLSVVSALVSDPKLCRKPWSYRSDKPRRCSGACGGWLASEATYATGPAAGRAGSKTKQAMGAGHLQTLCLGRSAIQEHGAVTTLSCPYGRRLASFGLWTLVRKPWHRLLLQTFDSLVLKVVNQLPYAQKIGVLEVAATVASDLVVSRVVSKPFAAMRGVSPRKQGCVFIGGFRSCRHRGLMQDMGEADPVGWWWCRGVTHALRQVGIVLYLLWWFDADGLRCP